MFTVLKHQTAVASCDTLNAAISLVNTLEAGLNRLTTHSPFTIVRTEDLPGQHELTDWCS